MASIHVIMRVAEWEKYKKGEESEGFSLSMNPAGKMNIVIQEQELLSATEHFAAHTPYLIYAIKKNV